MRRKLFNDTSSSAMNRRRLFSDRSQNNSSINVGRRRLFSDSSEGCQNVIICRDCGKTYNWDGTTTNVVCPNCGGNRFNYLNDNYNLNNHKESSSPDPTAKVFSDISKRNSSPSYKSTIVSNDYHELNEASKSSLTTRSNTPLYRVFVCQDCHHEFSSPEMSPSNVACPKCGGTRVYLLDEANNTSNVMYKDQEESDKLGELLKDYEGKTIKISDVEDNLHQHGIDYSPSELINAGYAEIGDNPSELRFSDTASLQRKIFSKLVISVTKEFDIDLNQNKESAISTLSESLPTKSIMILKKRFEGNNTPEIEDVNFSDKDYLIDSGIANDLSEEFGGTNMNIKDFMNFLSEEYPDAPNNMIDLLVQNKVIKINGSKVEILK